MFIYILIVSLGNLVRDFYTIEEVKISLQNFRPYSINSRGLNNPTNNTANRGVAAHKLVKPFKAKRLYIAISYIDLRGYLSRARIRGGVSTFIYLFYLLNKLVLLYITQPLLVFVRISLFTASVNATRKCSSIDEIIRYVLSYRGPIFDLQYSEPCVNGQFHSLFVNQHYCCSISVVMLIVKLKVDARVGLKLGVA